jgi:hypothetical protein
VKSANEGRRATLAVAAGARKRRGYASTWNGQAHNLTKKELGRRRQNVHRSDARRRFEVIACDSRTELARGAKAPRTDELSSISLLLLYFTLACAFRRSAQYRFIRADTAFRASADMVRVLVWTCLNDFRSARRPPAIAARETHVQSQQSRLASVGASLRRRCGQVRGGGRRVRFGIFGHGDG